MVISPVALIKERDAIKELIIGLLGQHPKTDSELVSILFSEPYNLDNKLGGTSRALEMITEIKDELATEGIIFPEFSPDTEHIDIITKWRVNDDESIITDMVVQASRP